MGFVEKEHQPRFVGIAHFGHLLEQFRQQPQQECCIKLRRLDQRIGGQNIHIAFAGKIGAHQIGQLQRRFAEEIRRPLRLQVQ